MTPQDRHYLLIIFRNYYKQPMTDKVAKEYILAERILKGYKQEKIRGCKCEYGFLKTSVDKLYQKFLDEQIPNTTGRV